LPRYLGPRHDYTCRSALRVKREAEAEGTSIGEVAPRAGARTPALRYYERAGLLPRPGRENGRRRYDGQALREALERLAVARVAQRAGFSPSRGSGRSEGGFSGGTPPSERRRLLAQGKLAEVEALVERALGMKDVLERGCAASARAWRSAPRSAEKPRGYARSGVPDVLFIRPRVEGQSSWNFGLCASLSSSGGGRYLDRRSLPRLKLPVALAKAS
jgi:MerR family redox-sensitive transcriptional activator SoxR